jgi:exopolysaccharide biosynthesis operon protein EpsL
MAHSHSGSSQAPAGHTGNARLLLRALAVALAATPFSAAALFSDRVEVFAAENVTWDSNVFRLDSNVGPIVRDTIYTTSLGVNAHVPVSLQQFELAFTYFRSNYQKTNELDFSGHTIHGGWLWSLTPRATGLIAYDESRSLASFTQFVGSDRTKDVLTTRILTANGAWYTTPTWRVHGGLGLSDQNHDDPARKLYDLRTGTGEVGLSYVTAQDNRVGVALRTERGESQDVNVEAGRPDFSYKQYGGGIVVHYAVTGHSMLDGRAEYTRRTYDEQSFRDFSGPTLRFEHTWNPTVKTKVVTVLRREVSPIQEVQSSNFVLVTGISVKPQWLVTEKVTLGGTLEYNEWKYKGAVPATGPAVGVPSGDYTNKVGTVGVVGSWKPTQNVFLVASYLHENRTSSLANQDYRVDVFSLEGRLSF